MEGMRERGHSRDGRYEREAIAEIEGERGHSRDGRYERERGHSRVVRYEREREVIAEMEGMREWP